MGVIPMVPSVPIVPMALIVSGGSIEIAHAVFLAPLASGGRHLLFDAPIVEEFGLVFFQ